MPTRAGQEHTELPLLSSPSGHIHCCHVQVRNSVLPLLPGQQSGLKKVRNGILEGGWVMISTTGSNLETLLFAGTGPDPYFRYKSVHIGRWAWGSSRISRVPKRKLSSIFWCLGGGKEGGEVLDREPGIATCPGLKGHFNLVRLSIWTRVQMGRKCKAASSIQAKGTSTHKSCDRGYFKR